MIETADDDRRRLSELRDAFVEVAGEDGSIDADELAAALGIRNRRLALRIFELFDADGNGRVDLQEFLDRVGRLSDGDPAEKVRFAFRVHDLDGSGAIARDELAEMIHASLAENRLNVPEEQVDSLVDALFHECDADRNGEISEDELGATLDRWPQLRDGLAVGAVHWLKPRRPHADPANPQISRVHWLRNHAVALVLFAIWVLVNVAFFAHAVQKYADAGFYVQVARGCGACLNVNGALILVPMMRNFLTWIRRTVFGHWIPIDHAIDFHRLVGSAMFAFALVHAAAHLFNYSTLRAPVVESVFLTKAGLTGFVLLVLFAVMTLTARDVVRRKGHFELFYFAHLLYIGWFGLMLVHGPRFWQFALLPMLGFAIDQIVSSMRRQKAMLIEAGNILASGVTELVIERPPHFEYEPGAYVFARIPAIAAHEWHPFTITSSPENRNTVTLHIRSAGNWTRRLHTHYKQIEEGDEAPHVYLDGPYGTPAVHILDSKVAVLVGGGIGVTPFASMLESLMARRQAGKLKNLEMVYFYWINREQRAFEWFAELLSRIESDNADGFFEIRIFMTGMKARTDLNSATLHIAMDLHHGRTQIDLVTGLQTRTRAGRPDWSAEFDEIRAAHRGDVDVFLCGPPGLSDAVRKSAHAHRFRFRREHF